MTKPKIVIAGKEFTNTFPERFWKKVKKGAQGECWIWIGAKQKGYGCIYPGGPAGTRQMPAHRLSYMMHSGLPIPDGMEIMHSCDNRACINPNHLQLGTHAENMRDSMNKGRNFVPKGQKNPRAHFTQAQVDAIRQELKTRPRYGLTSEIARRYGVNPSVISQIRLGYSWT